MGLALGRIDSSFSGSVATGPASDGTVGSTISLYVRVREKTRMRDVTPKADHLNHSLCGSLILYHESGTQNNAERVACQSIQLRLTLMSSLRMSAITQLSRLCTNGASNRIREVQSNLEADTPGDGRHTTSQSTPICNILQAECPCPGEATSGKDARRKLDVWQSNPDRGSEYDAGGGWAT